MRFDAAPFDLPFEEAIAWFRSKGYAISAESWRDVWRQANARAFTAARVTRMDVLVDIRRAVDKAIAEGTTLAEFKRDLIGTLESKGWWASTGEKAVVQLPDGTERKRLAPWRLETIFNTNVQTAYSVGRYEQQMQVAEQRPYWMYKHGFPKVPRPEHLEMDGKVWDYRHPIWDIWYPPNGYECKCYTLTLSPEEAAEEGIEVETRGVSARPDEGWDYNVGQAGLDSYKPDLSKYPPELAGQYREEEA